MLSRTDKLKFPNATSKSLVADTKAVEIQAVFYITKQKLKKPKTTIASSVNSNMAYLSIYTAVE